MMIHSRYKCHHYNNLQLLMFYNFQWLLRPMFYNFNGYLCFTIFNGCITIYNGYITSHFNNLIMISTMIQVLWVIVHSVKVLDPVFTYNCNFYYLIIYVMKTNLQLIIRFNTSKYKFYINKRINDYMYSRTSI
jgi:hypothetical protein